MALISRPFSPSALSASLSSIGSSTKRVNLSTCHFLIGQVHRLSSGIERYHSSLHGWETGPSMSGATISPKAAQGTCHGTSESARSLPHGTGVKQPVLLLDVMGTIVRDPFYEDMPRFFGLSFKELLQQKHPSAWIEFETGQLTEPELVSKFFADGRKFDYDGLKGCMASGYAYLEGMEELLRRLKARGYSVHAFTNYPCWYELIEDKLKLSNYMEWTFISYQMGKRKPDMDAYVDAARHLAVSPQDCIFVDDRRVNVDMAAQVGMKGLVFTSARQLELDLIESGVLL